MTVSATQLGSPASCRWEQEIAVMDYDTDKLYTFSFLVDDEGIEDHTISLWVENDGEMRVFQTIDNSMDIPDKVMDYLMELRFDPKTGELIKE